MIDTTRSWYALRVRKSKEAITAEAIRTLGGEACVPHGLVAMRARGTKRKILRPFALYDGYCFGGFHSLPSLAQALELQYVKGFVHSGDFIPSRVPVNDMVRIATQPAIFDRETDHLRVGSDVRVINDLFQGQLTHAVANKARVRLKFFGAEREVTTTVDRLKAA